jgi:hypothetical protein
LGGTEAETRPDTYRIPMVLHYLVKKATKQQNLMRYITAAGDANCLKKAFNHTSIQSWDRFEIKIGKLASVTKKIFDSSLDIGLISAVEPSSSFSNTL